MPKRFQKRKEDFVCAKCGFSVSGTGYTDHCPSCLWSRHCDINPGDRKANCQGLMEPVSVETISGKYIIHYRCLSCNHTFKVKASTNDNIEAIIKLSKGYA